MNGRRLGLTILCGLALMAAVPPAASAEPGYVVTKPSQIAFFQLRASHGYHLLVTSYRSTVFLLADRRGQYASYSIHHRPVGNGIEAGFGRVGRISVRFHPSGPPDVQDLSGSGCRGRNSFARQGTFEGTIRFRGEHGFSLVRATAAKGQIFKQFRTVCKRPPEPVVPPTEQPAATSLAAHTTSGHTIRTFTVYETEPDPDPRSSSEEANISATTTEHRGRIAIFRGASVQDEPSIFAVSPRGTTPTTASVTPSAPFSGSARFERRPGAAPTWRGDLSVELPGRGDVRFAGPSFSSRLCRNLSCACNRNRPCLSVGTVQVIRRAAERRRWGIARRSLK